MPRQPEGKLVRKIQTFLVERKSRNFKIQGGPGSFQEEGIPDLLCCYRGRFVGLEVKLPGEKPSPLQRLVLNEIADAGGFSAVVTTVEQVASLLADIDKEVDLARPHRRYNPFRFITPSK